MKKFVLGSYTIPFTGVADTGSRIRPFLPTSGTSGSLTFSGGVVNFHSFVRGSYKQLGGADRIFFFPRANQDIQQIIRAEKYLLLWNHNISFIHYSFHNLVFKILLLDSSQYENGCNFRV